MAVRGALKYYQIFFAFIFLISLFTLYSTLITSVGVNDGKLIQIFSAPYLSLLRQLRGLQNATSDDEEDDFSDTYDARLDMKLHNHPVWNELNTCPPLASIFMVNHANPIQSSSERLSDNDEVQVQLTEMVAATYPAYKQALHEREIAHISFLDYQHETSTFSQLPPDASSSFRSSSTFNGAYAIQTFENVCLQFNAGRPSLIFVAPKDDENVQTVMTSFTKEHQNKYRRNWIPFRYQNDQYKLERVDSVSPSWHFMQETAFHQLTWDSNPGHQFHWQVWPIFMALNFHKELNLSMVERLLVREGCAKRDEQDMEAEYLNVRSEQWKSINKLWARVALDERYERGKESASAFPSVKLVHSASTDRCIRNPGDGDGDHTLCFKKLLVSDTHDQFFDVSPHSPTGLMAFRKAAYRFLDLKEIPFPQIKSLRSARPLRVLIYSRMDSSRRRIENVNEIFEALRGPQFQVRHLPDFGARPPYEQLAAYAHADILIAPHGAHMTWSLMLPQNAVVLECFADAAVTFSWIKNMVLSVGVRRIEHIGIPNTANLPPDPSLRRMDLDFQVDIEVMCKQLQNEGIIGCVPPDIPEVQ